MRGQISIAEFQNSPGYEGSREGHGEAVLYEAAICKCNSLPLRPLVPTTAEFFNNAKLLVTAYQLLAALCVKFSFLFDCKLPGDFQNKIKT